MDKCSVLIKLKGNLLNTIKQLNFQINVFKNRNAMGYGASGNVVSEIKSLLDQKAKVRMIFAAAPSQNEFLHYFTRSEEIDWNRIEAFHMDEYINLSADAPQRFGNFLKRHLFDNVPIGNVHYLQTHQSTIDKVIREYASLLLEDEIDIVCMGIGENGHIAFNDPPVADFADPEQLKVVHLDEMCRQQQVNDGCFSRIEDVPTHALTLTVPALMRGKSIHCIVPGNTKQQAVHDMIYGPVTAKCPASILRLHGQCKVYLDRDSFDSSGKASG